MTRPKESIPLILFMACICLLVAYPILVSNKKIIALQEKIVEQEIEISTLERKIERLEKERIEERQTIASRGSNIEKNLGIFTATTYDLTVMSCGRTRDHKYFGLTANGFSLVGHDRESAMSIATDPKVIPTGSRVRLEFLEDEWKHWNGVYTARDTGGAIKGKIIDIFYKDTGDTHTDPEVWNFGRRKVKVTLLD